MRLLSNVVAAVVLFGGAHGTAIAAAGPGPADWAQLAQSTYYPPSSDVPHTFTAPGQTFNPPGQTYYPLTQRYYPAPSTGQPAPSSYPSDTSTAPRSIQSAPQRYYPGQPTYGGADQPYLQSGRYYPAPRRTFSSAPRRAPTSEEQAMLAWLPAHTRKQILSRLTVDQTAHGILETMVLNRLILDYAEARNMRWNGYGFVADVRPVDSYGWVQVEYDPVSETYRKVRDLY